MKNETPVARVKKPSFWKQAWEVVTDPGVAWGICDTLLFAALRGPGLVAYGSATLVSAACKKLSMTDSAFLRKHPRLEAVVRDPRAPLRAGGLASLLVAGVSLATGAFLPAVTSAFFALANFKIASSISRTLKGEPEKLPDKSQPLWKRALVTAFKRPDMYVAAGLMLAGMMAGGLSLWALPLVAMGFGVSLTNILKDRPEHASHPKLIYGLAAGVFAAVGLASDAPLICLAHVINSAVFFNVEGRVTPGGFSQVWADIKNSARNILSSGKKPKASAPAALVPSVPAASGVFPRRVKISGTFGMTNGRKVFCRPVQYPAGKIAATTLKI